MTPANQSLLPALDGITFRYFKGVSDVKGMYEVRTGSKAHDQIDSLSLREGIPSYAELLQSYSQCEAGDPSLLIVETQNQIIGYCQVFNWKEANEVWVYLHLGYLLPQWRGRGIGSAMLDWAKRFIYTSAQERGLTGKVQLATNASSTEREAQQLIEKAGYKVRRLLTEMLFNPETALSSFTRTLPPGIELRPVAEGHYPAIYAAYKASRQGMFGSTDSSEEDYRKFLAEMVETPNYDPTLWFVAWAGAEEVAGFVINQVLPAGVGEVAQVMVAPRFRRQGIARTLMLDSLRELRGRANVSQIRLYTDANDGVGARTLYEQVGFSELKQHKLYRKELFG